MNKEEAIASVIAATDFKGNTYSIKEIKERIKRAIGEVPGLDLEFNADTMLSEDRQSTKRIVEVRAIKISYTDGVTPEGIPIVKTLKLYV